MARISYTNVRGPVVDCIPDTKILKRKIESRKLAQVAAKDLFKRVPPASGHKAALRDPVVELDYTNKTLDDTCFETIADVLITTISHKGENGRFTRLEELCLSHNQLSVRALESLGRIVRLSSLDLRDMDISYNTISIRSNEDAEIFRGFLYSFSDCCMLRRIDFSGNDLGHKAFEIFARVYGQQNVESHTMSSSLQAPVQHLEALRLEPLKAHDANLNISLSTSRGVGDRSRSPRNRYQRASDMQENEYSVKDEPLDKSSSPWAEVPSLYRVTRGLRSVPYLVFQNTDMTDACALYLSYVLPIHGSPDHLLTHVPAAKAGAPAQRLASYDTQTGCLGIVYRPNRKLGVAGVRLLELAEQLRAGFSDGSEGDDDSLGAGTSPRSTRTSISMAEWRKPSTWSFNPAHRRISNSSSAAESDQDFQGFIERTLSSLETARHRIQGDVLRDHGPSSNDLWSRALRILDLGRTLSRTISDLGNDIQHGDPDPQSNDKPTTSDHAAFLPLRTPLQTKWKACQGAPMLRLGRKWINDKEEIVQIPLSPATAPSSEMETRGSDAGREPLPLGDSEGKHERKMKPRDHFQQPYLSDLCLGFTEDVWRRIIADATDVGDLMSETQQLSAVRYALNRETLAREAESLGKPQSAQCWKVLNGMGVLDYEMSA